MRRPLRSWLRLLNDPNLLSADRAEQYDHGPVLCLGWDSFFYQRLAVLTTNALAVAITDFVAIRCHSFSFAVAPGPWLCYILPPSLVEINCRAPGRPAIGCPQPSEHKKTPPFMRGFLIG